jgi:hypothetical protein
LIEEKKQFVEIVDVGKVRIGENVFEFRDPDEWTIGEVCKIEQESIEVIRGLPEISLELRMAKTVAHVVKGITEKSFKQMKWSVGNALYNLVRWRNVPLELQPSSGLPIEEAP